MPDLTKRAVPISGFLMSQPYLVMRAISKSFPGVHALDQASLEVQSGECHALVGENGAGKSTLMKVLAGAVLPDGGDIFLGGQKPASLLLWKDPAGSQAWVQMLELVGGRLVPIGVEPQQRDLLGCPARHRVLDPAGDTVDPFVGVPELGQPVLDVVECGDGPQVRRLVAYCEQTLGGSPIEPDVLVGGWRHAFKGVEEIDLPGMWSPSSSSVRATACMLPPRQTPHSTMAPGMRCSWMYLVAVIKAWSLSLLVMVKGLTALMISR